MIDEFLPMYDVRSKHQTVVIAPPDVVYDEVRTLDLTRSWTVRLLFRLRGIESMEQLRFAVLFDDPPRELLLGLIGKFWTSAGCLQETNADHFVSFFEAGYAKAVWNFSVKEQSNGMVILSTETRVLCLDEEGRKSFLRYWLLIRPFSGWIRRQSLRIVKRQAELRVVRPGFRMSL